ncbi:hypothetical protein [Streptomyces wuyuanensis]|uniref:hypothetical protein n=1 Tax=Streptomyces wuyuanensis TaxID=1196353 RepID=UPI003440FB09
MTPKLRTHCATTLAALVLALPVATYAYTDGPPAFAEASRGEGEGGRSSGGHGGDGRAGTQGRDESGRGGSDRNDGRAYGGSDRDDSPAYGEHGHHDGGAYGEHGHHGGGVHGRSDRDGWSDRNDSPAYGEHGHHDGGVHGRSGRDGDDARNGDRERPPGRSGQGGDGQGGAPDRTARGRPAHGSPSASRATVRTAPETVPGTEDDRQPAYAGQAGKSRTPQVEQAAGRPDPSPTASLAGRQAGEGRLRPGRTTAPSPTVSTSSDGPHDGHADHDNDHGLGHDHARERDEDATPQDEAEDESRDASDAPSSHVAPTLADDASPAAAGESHPQPVSQPLERRVPVLTLGAGCALMGLGLGYMGLRLRRG